MPLPAARADEPDDLDVVDNRAGHDNVHGAEVVRLAVAFQPDLPTAVREPLLRLLDEANLGFHPRLVLLGHPLIGVAGGAARYYVHSMHDRDCPASTASQREPRCSGSLRDGSLPA